MTFPLRPSLVIVLVLALSGGIFFGLKGRPQGGAVLGPGASEAAGIPEANPALAARLAEANDLKARERWAEAVSAYEKVMATYPKHPEAYFQLGALYFRIGLKSKSQENYLKAVALDYRNPEIYFHLGYIRETEGDLQGALEWYLKAEEKGVGSAELYFNTGNVFARLGNNTRALEYFTRAVSVNPAHLDAFVNLSVVSFYEKKFADAAFYLDKARALGYNPPAEYLDSLKAAEQEAAAVPRK